MKLPLFVHSYPFPSDSAIIRCAAGDWTVESNHKDAILNLSVDGTVYQDIKNGQAISIPSVSPVRASIVKGGTEKYINLSLDDNTP